MKILYHHRTRATDAQKVHILEMIGALRGAGHQVTVASLVETEKKEVKPESEAKEATWKTLKEEVSHHCWHETKKDLSNAVDRFYQTARQHTVNFLEKFGYYWQAGRIHPIPQLS